MVTIRFNNIGCNSKIRLRGRVTGQDEQYKLYNIHSMSVKNIPE